jgi:uncharacterized protein
MGDAATIQVVVVYSPREREVHEWTVALPAGATLLQALRTSGLEAAFPGLHVQAATVGVWGQKATLTQPLREGDRVEIYRPLKVDPKVARRERFRRQGARTAGPNKAGTPRRY